jgi:hypothetical protein
MAMKAITIAMDRMAKSQEGQKAKTLQPTMRSID